MKAPKPIDYSQFFRLSRRMNSTKPLAIVREDRVDDLVRTLVRDDSTSREYRLFVILLLSGGLRVSEGHSIDKKEEFFEEEGQLFCSVRVLKKRAKEEYRYMMIHPLATEFARAVLADKIGTLFNWTPRSSLNKVKALFGVNGICNHSFRHSLVTYLLFEKELSREAVSKLVHVSSKIIDVYAHLDEKRTLKKIFSGTKPKYAAWVMTNYECSRSI